MHFKLYRFGIILAASAVMLASFTPAGQKLEGVLLHLGSRLMPERAQDSAVVVVAVDDNSINAQGAWPWPRDRLAGVVDRLSGFKPNTIGLLLPLAGAETPRAVTALKQETESLEPGLQEAASEWLEQLDTDTRFAESLRAAGNVVLATPYKAADNPVQLHQALNPFKLPTGHESLSWFEFAVRSLQSAGNRSDYQIALPLPQFMNEALSIGLSPDYDMDQWVHGRSLATMVEDRYLPGFELSLWATERGMDSLDFSVLPGEPLQLADNNYFGAVDHSWYPHPALAPPVYSLSEVMRSDELGRALRNKSVLLGLTAKDLAPVLTGPAGVHYTPVTWSAQVLASLLAGNGITMPDWFYAAQRLLLILFAAYLVLIPGSWHGLRGWLVTVAISAVVVNAALGTLIVKNL